MATLLRTALVAAAAIAATAAPVAGQDYTCDGSSCRGESMTISIAPGESAGRDAEFGGNGPLAEAMAEWRVSEDRKRISLLLQMKAWEAEMKGATPDTVGNPPTILESRPISFLVVSVDAGCIADGGPMNLAAADSATVLLRGKQPARLETEGDACLAPRADRRACRVTNHGVVERWDLYGDTDGEDLGHTRALVTIRAPEFELRDCRTTLTRREWRPDRE